MLDTEGGKGTFSVFKKLTIHQMSIIKAKRKHTHTHTREGEMDHILGLWKLYREDRIRAEPYGGNTSLGSRRREGFLVAAWTSPQRQESRGHDGNGHGSLWRMCMSCRWDI